MDTRYVEGELGCGTGLLGSDASRPPCTTPKEIEAFWDLSDTYSGFHTNDMARSAGCAVPCTFSEYAVKVTKWERNVLTDDDISIVKVQVEYKTGAYRVREQHLIYDLNSFIRDVGGFIGLLLGHSIYSMYSAAVGWYLKVV